MKPSRHTDAAGGLTARRAVRDFTARRAVPRLAALLIYLASLTACSARRGEPLAGALTLSPEAARGRQVFMAKCHQCHPGGEAGLAPAINNKPLPGFMVKTQVRLGVGAMPRFSEADISPQELDDLVKYLKAVRRHG